MRRHGRPGWTGEHRSGADDHSAVGQGRAARPTLGSSSASRTERVPEEGVHGVGGCRSESVTEFLPLGRLAGDFGRGSVAADAECRQRGRSVDRLGTALWPGRVRWRPGGGSAAVSWRLTHLGPFADVTASSIEMITVRVGRRGPLRSARSTGLKRWHRTGPGVDMALSVSQGSRSGGRHVCRSDGFSGRTRTGNRTRWSRREAAARVEPVASPVAEWIPLRRELVPCRKVSPRRTAAESLVDLPRPRSAGSPVPADIRRSVRGGTAETPTSKKRRLTIRWPAAITWWTPLDSGSVVACGFLHRCSAESVARSAIVTGQPTRQHRRVEICARPQDMAAATSCVTNATSECRPRSVDGRVPARSRRSASCRPAWRRSAADWPSPVRWRTVAE